MRMAIALQNLGPDLQYGGTYLELERSRLEYKEEEFESFSLPVVVRMGLAYDPIENMTLVVNASHPNDSRERLDVGGEWWLVPAVALRAGYRVNSYITNYTGGVGVKFGGFHGDVAYVDLGPLTYSLNATVGYDF